MSNRQPLYHKGEIVSLKGHVFKINSSYYSPFRNEYAYFGSYIDRRTGKVIAHNDRTVGSGESEIDSLLAHNLKQYKETNIPLGVQSMERMK